MELFKYIYIENLLKPVFGGDLKLIEEDQDEADSSSCDELADESDRKRRRRPRRASPRRKSAPEEVLDMSGPKLIGGLRSWLILYQIIGQLNWLGKPLYLSIVYKALILALNAYILRERYIKRGFRLNLVDQNYRNPIFIFISLLAFLSCFCQLCVSIYTNLFKLCPMFKILTTPKLCFISEDLQHVVGSRTLRVILVFILYNTVIMSMLVSNDLNEFLNEFNVLTFVMDYFTSASVVYYLIGMSHLDFYIRGSFGCWLIALKGNLEYRFTHLSRHQRQARASNVASNRLARKQSRASSGWSTGGVADPLSSLTRRSSAGGAESAYHQGVDLSQVVNNPMVTTAEQQLQMGATGFKYFTLDEVQKNLNNMDDHLEVWRSVQTWSSVLISLNAFLSNGALLLLAYNLLANQRNYYHGLLLILVSANYTLVIFISYIGDSLIYYALASFVRTVEDEYFLQHGDEAAAWPAASRDGVNGDARDATAPSTTTSRQVVLAELEPGSASASLRQHQQLLLIKKKDVLFCREFLHQFENHLWTPWSKLTVKTHLHMLGTFVTLIAAQIIFDHEH